MALAEEGHGPGVGVEQTLGGLTGAMFDYDMGNLRFDLIFGFQFVDEPDPAPSATIFGIGGRIAYVIHRMGPADFSIGGGLAIVLQSQTGNSITNVQLEGFGQVRLFLAPNVAVLGSVGLAVDIANDGNITSGGPILFGPRTGIGIGGQLVGQFGFVYYFR